MRKSTAIPSTNYVHAPCPVPPPQGFAKACADALALVFSRPGLCASLTSTRTSTATWKNGKAWSDAMGKALC